MSELKEELAKRASGMRNQDTRNEDDSNGGCRDMDQSERTGSHTGIGDVRNNDSGHQKRTVRLLRADEIECRVSMINERGLSLLLFKDARVDQKILDETFTPFGWRRTHQCIDGNLYCTVEIWDEEKQQWIAKQDVGTTSYSEKEKGQASDSFKRACFNWGVGRELYTVPFIWIPAEYTDIQRKGERYTTSDRFSVQSIAYNAEREITALVITNKRGCKVFELREAVNQSPKRETPRKQNVFDEKKISGSPEMIGNQKTAGNQKMTGKKEEAQSGITKMQRAELQRELDRTGVPLETVLARYRIQSMEQMTPEIYLKALNSLKRSKTKIAA